MMEMATKLLGTVVSLLTTFWILRYMWLDWRKKDTLRALNAIEWAWVFASAGLLFRVVQIVTGDTSWWLVANSAFVLAAVTFMTWSCIKKIQRQERNRVN